MLYLAQVQKKGFLGKIELKLLAQEKADNFWAMVPEENNVISSTEASAYNEGMLVLVDLTEGRQIVTIKDATPWVISLVSKYLTIGVTPALLQQEIERAEQWRQSLTLQSQELGRRSLEVEARREQIQELEENLKQERKQLEAMAAQLQTKNVGL